MIKSSFTVRHIGLCGIQHLINRAINKPTDFLTSSKTEDMLFKTEDGYIVYNRFSDVCDYYKGKLDELKPFIEDIWFSLAGSREQKFDKTGGSDTAFFIL